MTTDRPSRAQLADQLADRCDEVARLRTALAEMEADRDDWREIASSLLRRNATLVQTQVLIYEPKTQSHLNTKTAEWQAAAYRAASQQPKGRG